MAERSKGRDRGATVSPGSASLTAIADAAAITRRHASDVFQPDWPVGRVAAVREDLLDEELARR